MLKSYMTHLAAILLLHLLLILGSWQLNESSISSGKKTAVITMQLSHKKESIVRSLPRQQSKPKTSSQVPDTQQTESVESNNVNASPGDSAREAELIDLYKAELREKIDQNKFYPALSRRLGQTGTVIVAFTLLEDGQITNIRVDRPSVFEKLNEAGVEAVKKVNRFKPIPGELGINQMDLTIPVKFVTL